MNAGAIREVVFRDGEEALSAMPTARSCELRAFEIKNIHDGNLSSTLGH